MLRFVVSVLCLALFSVPANAVLGAEIKRAAYAQGADGPMLVVTIAASATTDPRTPEYSLDERDCLAQAAPVAACVVKLRDHYARYRYGAVVTKEYEFPLRPLGLNLPAYSEAKITVAGDASSAVVQLPLIAQPSGVSLHRLRRIQTKFPASAQGFSHLALSDQFQSYLFGVTGFMGPGFGLSNTVMAYDNNQDRVAWRTSLASGSSVAFIAASPYDQVLAAGGRFSVTGDSNLHLIDAATGEVVRKMLGVEHVDVSSSFWIDHQVLVSHASLTDRQVSGNSVIDRRFLKGLITWHDTATGRLIDMMDSPLFEASVIEQSSDRQMVAFAGYEGAAIVDNNTREVVFSLHFSDIYGAAYKDCANFGCGPNRAGFAHFDISADRRVFAVSTIGGPIYVGNAEDKRIAFDVAPKTLDGQKLYIRKLKVDALGYKLYVYAAESIEGPSTAWVMVYNLVDGSLVRVYQGGQVPGMSGGNQNGSIFSSDLTYLYTSDSADGVADSRMVRPAQFRVFALD